MFSTHLANAIREKRTPVLVGLDPRYDLLPPPLFQSGNVDTRTVADAFVTFCCGVIDVVAPLVPAVKPQAAFFEQYGPDGMLALGRVISYARKAGLIVIFDGKRNDIGSTATAYASGILGAESAWQADALTVSPYLGDDSLTPFVDIAKQRDAGVFILVKTSNPGGAMLQDLTVDGKMIYRRMAEYVESLAFASMGGGNSNDNVSQYSSIGAVVGATWSQQLAELRTVMPHTWFLVPGFGSQGGTAKDVAAAFDVNGLGAIINNSRGILYAYRSGENKEVFGAKRWQEAVESATKRMIEQLKTETPAGVLEKQNND
jgi:orotidine-5'-phosphate decarboxylase